MMEAGVLLGLDNVPLFWHTPNQRNGGALPDSRDLWEFIWTNRAIVTGFAHTHPGSGIPGPSYTDVTTFAAIEAALGKHLNWFILSSDSQVVCLFDNEAKTYGKYVVSVSYNTTIDIEWMSKLRDLSHYNQNISLDMVG